ncbi:hypothetical protein L1987_55915 [Smallanthus sonchifolius]|uniref:Uncharacterized protein n=1 Tax=Smallanthus sonchifolius TaxID=185202 RepID=A0ACB9ECD8_9ASTR|nr:hypothetical protein L1987_55915 [Smallanthus sonchifolius]
MDTSLRPTTAVDPTMESGDWRAQPQRQRIVIKIMDTLKRHLPFTGYERLQELKKIAESVEQEIYTAATSQSEYSRKTCFMILSVETRLESPISDPMQSNSAANIVRPSVPFDSMAQTDNPNGGDWQEEVYQKINAMKDLYHLDLRPIHGAPGTVGDPNRTVESGDWRATLRADSRQRIVNKILDTLKRHLPFSVDEGLEELKKIAERFEGKTYTAATSQSDYLRKISLKMLTMETRSQNPMSDPTQSNSAANSVNPSVPLNFTAQTVNLNGGDWQEEVYQKHQATKGESCILLMQSQPGKQQQQVDMQLHPNLLQRDMQRRLATAGGFQQQNHH